MITSSGLLIYNFFDNEIKFFLVHPGGPFWDNKPNEGWGIPKGKKEKGEELLETAKREVKEELGSMPSGHLTHDLGEVKQSAKKKVYCFAWFGTIDKPVKSQEIEIKYKDKIMTVPEISEGKWFTSKEAKGVIIPKQYEFIERLLKELGF